jgi:hypothetical protein
VAIGGLGDRVIHMSSGEISEVTVNEKRVSLDEIEW